MDQAPGRAHALTGRRTTIQTKQPKTLYAGLVGPQWANLAEPVRRLHTRASTLHGSGRFTVRHGERSAARWLARLLRLPAAGADVPVKLVVTPHAQGERWARTFGATPFVTEQSAAGDGATLVERIGPTEVKYNLEIAGGALYYRQIAAYLRLGPLSLPLPRWLAPHIAARESAMPDEKSTHISVKVTLPAIGLLVSYKGYIEIKD